MLLDNLVHYGCPIALVTSYIVAFAFWLLVPKQICTKFVTPIMLFVMMTWFIGAPVSAMTILDYSQQDVPEWLVFIGLMVPFVFPATSKKWLAE